MIFGYLTYLILLGVMGLLVKFGLQCMAGDWSVFTRGGWGACIVAVAVVSWKIFLAIRSHAPLTPEDNLAVQARRWFNDRGGEGVFYVVLSVGTLIIMLPIWLRNPQATDASAYHLLATAILPTFAIVSDAVFASVVLEKRYHRDRMHYWR